MKAEYVLILTLSIAFVGMLCAVRQWERAHPWRARWRKLRRLFQ